jgi:hypothetical protein
MPDTRCLPEGIYGVDFSGAKKAGTKISIASGTIMGDALQIRDCSQAKELFGATGRDLCLLKLQDFISSKRRCAFGLDFPFGLPRDLVKASSWEEFVLSFGSRYTSAQEFTRICRDNAHGKELRRCTDEEQDSPLCAYNLRLFRQTYFGIRDVLAPRITSTIWS